MVASDLIGKLKASVPNAVLDNRAFGRSDDPSVWIEMKSILKVAAFFASEGRMDWLEHLSVVDIDGALLISYFVRSGTDAGVLVIRGTVLPAAADAHVDIESVTSVWPMANSFELENTALFGIRFTGGSATPSGLLPEGWLGFPLRKGYVFPAEFGGIRHRRGGV